MEQPDSATLDVFGKILYAVAMADGEVQQQELDELKRIVEEDKWAKEIELSFNEAIELQMDPKIVFYKNIRIFKTLEAEEYIPYFVNLMERIAEAYDGIIPEEKELITTFCEHYKNEHPDMYFTKGLDRAREPAT